jgi:5-methyltetrahydropteroyltriglutamate--homocysteine methyltransferase
VLRLRALVPGETKPSATRSCRSSPTARQQISIEAAQPKLDLGVLKDLAPRQVMLGVLDLADPKRRRRRVAARIRAALKHLPADKLVPAPDCGHEIPPALSLAFAKLKAL